MFVPTDSVLLARYLCPRRVQHFVYVFVGGHERFVSFPGIPEIDGEVNRRAKGITQKTSLAVVRIAPEKLGPVTRRAIGVLEPFLATRLDFELPERYTHRCPISRSLDIRISASKLFGIIARSGRVYQSDWIQATLAT